MEAVQVLVDLLDGLVEHVSGLLRRLTLGKLGARPIRQVPYPVVPANYAVDALVYPLTALVPGSDEHEVAAYDVCADGVDVFVGGDDVAPGLAHLLPVADDDALVVKADEGLVEIEEADVPEGLDEESGVEEVHDGVLCASGVLVDGEPVLELVGAECAVAGVGRGVLQEVP